MTKPFKSETRYRGDWAVTIYRSEADNGFYTECVSPNGAEFCTEVSIDKGSAWQNGYNYVDRVEKEERIRLYRAVAVPLTLALLYVSGGDEYYEYVGPPKKLRGRRAYKNYDWDILNFLTDQNLLEEQRHPQKNKSVVLTPEGIEQAKLALHKIGLPGIQDFVGTFELDEEEQVDEQNQQVSDE